MFNEKTTLAEILKLEHGEKVLKENGVPCLSCPLATQEIEFLEIGQVAEMYGLDKEKILQELNRKN